MVNKNILLTLCLVLIAIGLAGDSRFSGVFHDETIALDTPATDRASAAAGLPLVAQVPPAQASAFSAAAPSVPVSAPLVVPVQQLASQTNAEPVQNAVVHLPSEVIAALPNVVKPGQSAGGYLVSEWLEVPQDVIERVRSLPSPILPKGSLFPEVAPQAVDESGSLSASLHSAVTARRPSRMHSEVLSVLHQKPAFSTNLSPALTVGMTHLAAAPAPAKPFLRRVSLVETSSSTRVSAGIIARALSPTLPPSAAGGTSSRKLRVIETIPQNLKSQVVARQLLPVLPRNLVGAPSFVSFDKTNSAALQVTAAIMGRAMLPLLAKPTIKTSTLRPTTFVETPSYVPATFIVGRALMPLIPNSLVRSPSMVESAQLSVSASLIGRGLAAPIIAKPTMHASAPAETAPSLVSAEIAARQIMPVIPKMRRSFSFVETASIQPSTGISARPLLASLPGSLLRSRGISLVETAQMQTSSAVLARPLSPVLEMPRFEKSTTASTVAAAVATESKASTAAVIDSALTARNVAPKPVMINGQAGFSSSLLSPLSWVPSPSQMTSQAPLNTTDGGPSDTVATADRSTATTDAAAPSPFLVTSLPGFSVDMLKPMSSRPVFPPNPDAVRDGPDGSYCDPNFVGPPIRFSQTVELKLEDLLNQLNARFGVNFVVGPEVGNLPLNVKAGSIPWNILLRSQLYVSGVRATCVDSNTIELVRTDKVNELEKSKSLAEKFGTRYYKLRYLQPISSENTSSAAQSSTSTAGGSQSLGTNGGTQGCQEGGAGGSGGGAGGGGGSSFGNLPQRCKFERLKQEIRQILGVNEGTSERTESTGVNGSTVTYRAVDRGRRPYVGQVPGRNMLWVYGTESQFQEIDELVKRADVPPWQVIIKGLVYTANEDKLKDIGVQTRITTGNAKKSVSGGVFGDTLGTLGTLFDFSALVGTTQFNVDASALQRDGVISIKSRPFAAVQDGFPADLAVGRQVPVIVQAITPVGGAAPGSLDILQAANLLSVTPHVIDDDRGNPVAVNLELRLDSNEVDAAVSGQGVPIISVRSIQSNFNLNMDQTAILGGFTVDSDNKSISKTPGLGDIPIIGELFKRRIRTQQLNRLYFAVSVTVLPWGSPIEAVPVPGATTNPPTLTPNMKKRSDAAEPKQVVAPVNPH